MRPLPGRAPPILQLLACCRGCRAVTWKVHGQLSLDLTITGRQRIGRGDTHHQQMSGSASGGPQKRECAQTLTMSETASVKQAYSSHSFFPSFIHSFIPLGARRCSRGWGWHSRQNAGWSAGSLRRGLSQVLTWCGVSLQGTWGTTALGDTRGVCSGNCKEA